MGGMMWGRHKENGVWWALAPQYRIMFGGDRLVYLAFYRLRIRLMNPARPAV